jgi:hypothetical protein
MVLPPSCCGNSVSHLHTAGKEATCHHTVSLGIRLGTLEEEEREKDGAKPEVLVVALVTLYQLPLHACEHGHTPVIYMCLLALNSTMHVHLGNPMKGRRSSNLPNN